MRSERKGSCRLAARQKQHKSAHTKNCGSTSSKKALTQPKSLNHDGGIWIKECFVSFGQLADHSTPEGFFGCHWCRHFITRLARAFPESLCGRQISIFNLPSKGRRCIATYVYH